LPEPARVEKGGGTVAVDVRVLTAGETARRLDEIRLLLHAGFVGDFSEEDWAHALGGWHVVALDDGDVVAHAAVVPRTIRVADEPFLAGYVEGVATLPDRQGEGLGSLVMEQVTRMVARQYQLGVLSTALTAFYRRFGWEPWGGPSYVRDGDRLVRTADEDDGIMVLRCGPTLALGLDGSIICDRRSGDDW